MTSTLNQINVKFNKLLCPKVFTNKQAIVVVVIIKITQFNHISFLCLSLEWSEKNTAASFLGAFMLLGWFDVFFVCLFHSTCCQVSRQWCLGTQWFLRSLLLLVLLLALLDWISLNWTWPVFVHNMRVVLLVFLLLPLRHLFDFIVIANRNLYIFCAHRIIIARCFVFLLVFERWKNNATWLLLLYFFYTRLELYRRE